MKGVAALGYSPHEGHLPLPHEPAWHAAPQVPPVWAAPPLPGVEGTHSPLLFSLEETQEHITLPSRANSDFFTAVQQEISRLQAHPAAGQMQEELHAQAQAKLAAPLWLETPPSASGTAVHLTLENNAPEEVPLPLAFPFATSEASQDAQPEGIPEASQPMPCPASQSPLEIAHGLNAQYEAPCPAQPQLEDSGALLLAQTVLAV